MSTSNTKKIGLITATIVGMNAMIGAGIFSVPAALAINVGPAGIITYAFVIVAVWFMGSSLARLAELFPEEGSFYAYAKQWGGHYVGLFAAGCYLIGVLIAMGLLAKVAGIYLHSYLSFLSAFSWGILCLLALTLLNIAGVVLSEIGQYILICTTIFPLLATIALCLSNANLAYLSPFIPEHPVNILEATKAVIFGFFGFECAASLFTIVEQPEKNVAKALTFAIAIVGTIYLLFVISLLLAVPASYFSLETPLSETLQAAFPDSKWLITGIHISILSAVLGTIHSMIWSVSALVVSYVKQFNNRLLTSLATSKSSQQYAVLFVAFFITISFLTIHNINLFFSLTALFIIVSFVTSIITLLTLKTERSPSAIIKTVIGLATAGIILYFSVQEIIAYLLVG